MTEEQANQLLRGAEALRRAGRGVCSQKTYDMIVSVLRPEQRITDTNEPPCFAGIVLYVSPYIQDGVIMPWPRTDIWGEPKFKKDFEL